MATRLASKKRRGLSGYIVGLLVLASGAAAALWLWQTPRGSSLTIDTITEPLVGAARAVLELDLGAGRLRLGAGSRDAMLAGRVETLTGIETFERTATAQNGAMHYRLVAQGPTVIRDPARWPMWTLEVHPEIALELSIRGGLGDSAVDLSGLHLRKLDLATDAGRYTVTLPERGQVQARIRGGTGRTTLLIPKDVPVKVTLEVTGPGHIDFGGRLYRRDATFTSPGYGLSAERLELLITSTLAHVVVEYREQEGS